MSKQFHEFLNEVRKNNPPKLFGRKLWWEKDSDEGYYRTEILTKDNERIEVFWTSLIPKEVMWADGVQSTEEPIRDFEKRFRREI